jgi:hypothetical protein
MLKESVTAKDVCKLMNELLAKDSDCVHRLVNTRIKCNDDIANHPTVQVQQYKRDKFPKVGLLGIINGLFGIREDGMGAICIDVDDKKILKFKPTPKKKKTFYVNDNSNCSMLCCWCCLFSFRA